MTDLARIEQEALLHLQNAQNHALSAVAHMKAFLDCADLLQKGGYAALNGMSWDEYTRNTFNVSASRLRQLRAATTTGQLLIELTGVQPDSERQLRTFNQLTVGMPDDLKVEAWARAAAATDGSPAPRHIRAAVEVLTERDQTGGYVSVDGTSIRADVPLDSTQLAIMESVQESNRRRSEHLNYGKAYECEIGCIESYGHVWFILVGDLPENVIGKQVKVYVRA